MTELKTSRLTHADGQQSMSSDDAMLNTSAENTQTAPVFAKGLNYFSSVVITLSSYSRENSRGDLTGREQLDLLNVSCG